MLVFIITQTLEECIYIKKIGKQPIHLYFNTKGNYIFRNSEPHRILPILIMLQPDM